MKRILNIFVPSGVVALVAAAALAVATPAHAEFVYGTYSHSDPKVTCNTTYNGYGQVVGRSISVDTPVLLTPRGTQQVSYQIFLYRWDATRGWVYQVANHAVFGPSGTYSLASSPGFTINAPGSYWRVAVAYKWFWNGIAEVSQFDWAGVHSQFFVQNNGSMTSMWSGTTGSYCYIA
jgi:hypothetical protein